MELKYYTILTSPHYNNPSLFVKDWNKENYPFGFGGVNYDGTECIWAEEQEVYLKKDVDEAIAELKAKLQNQCVSCPVKMQEEDVIAELKDKLENVQTSMYADVVDANMENRRLKRALWLARADAAESEARGWYHSTGYCVKYDGGHTIKGALNGKGLLRLPEEWMRKWLTVERKCRTKAEEYK